MSQKKLFIVVLFLITGCSAPLKNNRLKNNRHPSSMDHLHEMNAVPETCDETHGTLNVSKEQQIAINEIMGSREHRLQHALWHASRSELSNAEKHQILNAFGKSWGSFHNLCPSPKENADDLKSYNPAGEDFLYMHREMIHM